MKAIRVRVENGRISGDAPPVTPDGDLDMRIAEPEDDMSDEELARLNEALGQGFEQIKAGQFRPAADAIAELATMP
jgi:hypothetical protein